MKPVIAVALVCLAALPAHAALVVSKAPTSNVACVSGVCTATAADAVLNAGDLKHMLAAGDVTLVSGSVAEDIAFDAKLQWTKPSRLTLDAWRGIAISLDITSEGAGGVTLTTNDGGSGGDLVFTGKGKVSFWDTSSSLIIDGTAYTLVDSIQALASAAAANPNGFYALSKFYDASADGTYLSDPVPGNFAGTFEGLGHVIDAFKLAPPPSADFFFAMFRNIAQGGVVRDLTFTNASLRSRDGAYGAILAAVNEGTISHVSVAGSIVANGKQGSGVLVGGNEGAIAWCTTSGSVIASGGDSGAGGLAAENSNGTIAHSLSTAAVQGHFAGGLTAYNFGTIETSAATGAVNVDGSDGPSYTGGFAAMNRGLVDQSFSTGGVNGGPGGQDRRHHNPHNHMYAAGFLADDGGTITNSYSTGSVSVSGKSVSGAFSMGGAPISSSYSTGADIRDGKVGRYGFVKTGTGSANDYWDTDTSGTTIGCKDDCTGITGLTTAQLQAGLPSGFDPSVWAESASVNNGFPYLIANPPQ
jgi:hypothetical protein